MLTAPCRVNCVLPAVRPHEALSEHLEALQNDANAAILILFLWQQCLKGSGSSESAGTGCSVFLECLYSTNQQDGKVPQLVPAVLHIMVQNSAGMPAQVSCKALLLARQSLLQESLVTQGQH